MRRRTVKTMTGTPFRVLCDPVGFAGVEVDDREIGDDIDAVEVVAQRGEPTRLILHAQQHGLLDGVTGVVEVHGPGAGGDAVRALDPEQVRARAMRGVGVAGDVTAAYLETIAAMVDEAAGG